MSELRGLGYPFFSSKQPSNFESLVQQVLEHVASTELAGAVSKNDPRAGWLSNSWVSVHEGADSSAPIQAPTIAGELRASPDTSHRLRKCPAKHMPGKTQGFTAVGLQSSLGLAAQMDLTPSCGGCEMFPYKLLDPS